MRTLETSLKTVVLYRRGSASTRIAPSKSGEKAVCTRA
jgi:hypothetical protein